MYFIEKKDERNFIRARKKERKPEKSVFHFPTFPLRKNSVKLRVSP